MDKEQKAARSRGDRVRPRRREAIFAVDYRGISVPQAAELRGKLGEADATSRSSRTGSPSARPSRPARKASTSCSRARPRCTYIAGDPSLAAKAISSFSREHDVLTYKGGLMDGEALDPDGFKAIARLPGLDVLHGQLVGLAASPLTGLVRGLGALVSGLAIALGQIDEQGLVGGEAGRRRRPEAEEAADAEEAAEEARPKPRRRAPEERRRRRGPGGGGAARPSAPAARRKPSRGGDGSDEADG